MAVIGRYLSFSRWSDGGDKIQINRFAATTVEYYDNIYSTSQEYRKEPEDCVYYELWGLIADMIGKDERILEIGCGCGHLAKLLKAKGIKKENYYGFDFSPVAIKQARKRVPEFAFAVLNANDERLAELNYDVVVAVEVFEHLEDDLAVVKKIRKGARIIFSVPNYLWESHVRCFRDELDVEERYIIYMRGLGSTRVRNENDTYIFVAEGWRV